MWRVDKDGPAYATLYDGNRYVGCVVAAYGARIVAAMNAAESTITEGLYTGARKRMPQPSASEQAVPMMAFAPNEVQPLYGRCTCRRGEWGIRIPHEDNASCSVREHALEAQHPCDWSIGENCPECYPGPATQPSAAKPRTVEIERFPITPVTEGDDRLPQPSAAKAVCDDE